MGYSVNHDVRVVLDREAFDRLRGARSISTIWEACVRKHGIGLQEKPFFNLTANRVQWHALYAWVLADTMGVRIKDLFVIEKSEGDNPLSPLRDMLVLS